MPKVLTDKDVLKMIILTFFQISCSLAQNCTFSNDKCSLLCGERHFALADVLNDSFGVSKSLEVPDINSTFSFGILPLCGSISTKNTSILIKSNLSNIWETFKPLNKSHGIGTYNPYSWRFENEFNGKSQQPMFSVDFLSDKPCNETNENRSATLQFTCDERYSIDTTLITIDDSDSCHGKYYS